MKSKSLLIVAAVLAAQVALYLVYRRVEHSRTTTAKADERFSVTRSTQTVAPPLTLERRDGAPVKLELYRGQVVVLHFWSTWCSPCVDELPDLLRFGDELESSRVRVLAVSVDESWESIDTFFDQEVPKNVVRASKEEVRMFPGSTLPRSFFIDPQGVLAFEALGARRWGDSDAKLVVSSLK